MPRLYQIRVGKLLDETWNEWFDGLTLTPKANGITLLSGELSDQTALHSMLNKIRNLNMDLVSVSCTKFRRTTMRQNSFPKPWLMLFIRSLFFLAFQALITLVFLSLGSSTSWLSSLLAAVTLIQSAVGAFHPQIFRDPAMTAGNACGTDVVILFVALPVLVVSMILAQRDSVPLFIGLTVIGLVVSVAYLNFLRSKSNLKEGMA
jgi:hypothetical protein